jgi:uncharacterized membrane protein YqiK
MPLAVATIIIIMIIVVVVIVVVVFTIFIVIMIIASAEHTVQGTVHSTPTRTAYGAGRGPIMVPIMTLDGASESLRAVLLAWAKEPLMSPQWPDGRVCTPRRPWRGVP